MALTENIGLNVISPTEDMSVYAFLQKLAGTDSDSNMVMIDSELQNLKAIDPDGTVAAAGGIVPYISGLYDDAEVTSY